MKWNKYTLKTTTSAVDFVSGIFVDLGIEGIEINDNVQLSPQDKEKMFVDILAELPADDGTAYISFYLEEEADEKVLDRVREELDNLSGFVDVGEGSICVSQTEDVDWINNWKKFFKPFTVDEIVIKPTWEELPATEEKTIISIDPGTAFGTGMHETTQLCIRQLKKFVTRGSRVLDAGCGSGILSIVAAKYGAEKLTAIDIDENAVIAAKENMEINNVNMDLVEITSGNLLTDKNLQDNLNNQCYDVVVANILADVIIPLSKMAAGFLKSGGVFISSGIIFSKEEAVVKAIKETEFLEIIEITRQGDWVSVTAVNKRD